MVKTRNNVRVANRQAVRPLRTVRENRAERVRERWYENTAVPIASSDNPSQQGFQSNVSTVSNVLDAIINQPISDYKLYEMTASEVKKHRLKLYALNKEGKHQFYTRYLDGRYLMVIRMR